jgi:aromatic-L-amino-acid/L-tryptophan decarboxylase
MQWDVDRLANELDAQIRRIRGLPVSAHVERGEILREVEERYPFAAPRELQEVAGDVVAWLERGNLHNVHPRYFGLFVPGTTLASVTADLLAAAFNPQVGGWFHSPAAVEIEEAALRVFTRAFGFDVESSSATFTTGGSEANLTGALTALVHRFPDVRDGGLRALPGQPVLFVSAEAHHSFWKVAQHAGLGRDAVRVIATDASLRMDADALVAEIGRARSRGELPFLVVATAGTTAAGAVDPLPELAAVCARERLWMHVDAAWGGAAILSPRLRGVLRGIELADSITCDAHKWLSVTMGAGMFFTRHAGALDAAFSVDPTYVPRGSEPDLYRRSLQWSRRFIGLKVFMTLAQLGTAGMARQLERQADLGELLRTELRRRQWSIVNDTPLPLVCFSREGVDSDDVVRRVNERGGHWISTAILGGARKAIRACITNHKTGEADVVSLADAVDVGAGLAPPDHRTPG